MSVIGLLGILAMLPAIPASPAVVLAFLALSLMLYGIAALDAYLMARRLRDDYKPKDYNRWYAYLLLYVAVSGGYIFSGLYVRDHLLQAFIVPGSSMYPAIWPGDHLLAAKNAYLDKDPTVGDIVLFRNPDDRRQFFIKRVVALGGDSVEIRNGELYINDIKLKLDKASPPTNIPMQIPRTKIYFDESNKVAKYRICLPADDNSAMRTFPKTVVPKNCCFVLGDNRADSLDSRNFGAIPIVGIIGKARFIYVPGQDWSRFGTPR